MVTSPSRSPLPRWNNTFRGADGGNGGVRHGSGQLLDELEALSQALYQSQKKTVHGASQPSLQPQAQAPAQPFSPQLPAAKNHSFGARKDASHAARRRSNEPPTGQSSSMEAVPFSGLSPNDPPPSFANLLSRHSLSSAHAAPESFEQQKSATSSLLGRFSSSLVPSPKTSAWVEEKPEVRSRTDRRLSLQPSLDKSVSQEQQRSLEDSLESSRRFDSSSSDKKKSVWSSWKPLRALSHIGRQRLHCVFSAYVHAIEGLPPAMNGLRLCVHLRKEETKEGAVQTMPSRVFQGIAEFQETLFMKCTLYGSKVSSSATKFMEKAFIVSVIAPDIDELDFGRHQLDLSRLLGDFLEESKGQLEKGSSWDTTLDLTGKAKGGRLAITFNYELLDKDSAFSGNVSSRFQDSPHHRSSAHNSYSLPNSAHGTPRSMTTRTHLGHSPSASEPIDDYDDMFAMDQLNLDDPPPQSKASALPIVRDARGLQNVEVQGFRAIPPQPECPPVASSHVAFNAFGNAESMGDTYVQADDVFIASGPLQSSEWLSENTPGVLEVNDDLPSEEEDEFVVVDQGMEIGEPIERSFVGQYTEVVEEEASEDLIPHVVEMDAMDDLPQMVDINALDDSPPQMVLMEAFDDLPPSIVEMQASDKAVTSVKERNLNSHGYHEASSQVAEKEEPNDLAGYDDDDQTNLKADLRGQSVQQIPMKSNEADKEVQQDIEKVVTVDEGGRKDTVTYVMVMQTLDSLLQGTSSKELLEEEERIDSNDDGIFSEEGDAADKEVISITSTSKVDEDSRNSKEELPTEAYDDDSYDSEEFEEKACGSEYIEEMSVHDIAEEEKERPAFLEERERLSSYFADAEENKEDINFQDAESTSFNGSDDEDKRENKQIEDAVGDRVLTEEVEVQKEVGNEQAAEEEQEKLGRGESNSLAKANEGFADLDGLEKEAETDKERDNKINNSDENVLETLAKEEIDGENSLTDIILLKEDSTERKNNYAGSEDADREIDLVSEDTDSEIDLVTGKFLDMLGMEKPPAKTDYDSEIDSPRARLWKEFEKDASMNGGFGLNFDVPEFLLNGKPGTEDAVCPQTTPSEGLPLLKREVMDKESNQWHTSTAICVEEVNKRHQIVQLLCSDNAPYASSCKEEEPAALNLIKGTDKEHADMSRAMAFEDRDKKYKVENCNSVSQESAKEDVPLALESELVHGNHPSASKVRDEDLARWNCTLPLRKTEDEPANLGQEKKSDDRKKLSSLDQMDEEPSNWVHKNLRKTESASWDDTLTQQDSNKELLKANQHPQTQVQLASMDVPYQRENSESMELEKDLVSRSVDLSSNVVDEEPVNLEQENKSYDRNTFSSVDQMDEESSTWVHKNLTRIESASWDDILTRKEEDSKEPFKANQNPQTQFQLTSMELPYYCENSKAIELEKGLMSRSVDLSSNAVDEEPENWEFGEDEELMSFLEAAESELQRASKSMESKSRAQILDDAETEALMQEWGLNEKAFVSSPPRPLLRQLEPPPLGKGLGAALPLKDGGSLRSMSPSVFQGSKSTGKLVMQISKPIVVPTEMGTETADILRNMASMGIENMAVQAMAAMPLEDITGCSVEQVATEGISASKPGHRQLEGATGSRKDLMSRLDHRSRTSYQNAVDDVMTLDDIAPMAMQQIEALAIDGLKIQADVEEDDSPIGFSSFSLNGESATRDMSGGAAVVKGVAGVHLAKAPVSSADISSDGAGKGLMGMAITLDEWMLLDAGLYDEAETNKNALAIMAAHQAGHQEMVVAGDDEKKKKRQGSNNTGARWGCMGNTLTIAMLVQLRDPLKNNEAVGAPMMAFVQAERMMKPPKMKVGRNVSMKGNSEEDEEGAEEPQFKITGVQMSGMKAPAEAKKITWGNQKQVQSGSRWLLANGMTKNAKANKPMLGSAPSAAMASASSSKASANKGESLWSISARALSGFRWRDRFK